MLASDGRGAGEVLLRQPGRLTPFDYSRDGRYLIYQPGPLGMNPANVPDDGGQKARERGLNAGRRIERSEMAETGGA